LYSDILPILGYNPKIIIAYTLGSGTEYAPLFAELTVVSIDCLSVGSQEIFLHEIIKLA